MSISHICQCRRQSQVPKTQVDSYIQETSINLDPRPWTDPGQTLDKPLTTAITAPFKLKHRTPFGNRE